jgi:hypothetical protein
MISLKSLAPRLAVSALAIAGLVLPTIASAQDIPSYAQPNRDETIHGRITSVNGTFNISVRDDRGFVDNVELHQGTIINPTGLTLASGMNVTVIGIANGGEFDANEIDTPYHYAGPAPEPIYLGPGWWYPGFPYGYGPAFGLTLVFGGGGFFFEHRPFIGRPFAFDHFGRPGVIGGIRAPLGTVRGRSIEPVGRAPQGAWRSFNTSRSGFTSRGFNGSTSRGFSGSTSRGLSGSTSRGFSGATSRGSSTRGSSRSTGSTRSSSSRGGSSGHHR